MIGAIIGDTIGSIYEFDNIKTKDFDFWGEGIEPTDDSVLTFATANWLLRGGEAWRHYCDFATEYDNPMGEYGSGFLQFVANARRGGKPQPYNSCGNGSAMRVGPVGWAFDTMDELGVRHHGRGAGMGEGFRGMLAQPSRRDQGGAGHRGIYPAGPQGRRQGRHQEVRGGRIRLWPRLYPG